MRSCAHLLVVRKRHRRHQLLLHERQERVVDLHIKPGVGDRLVFDAQRFREREQIALFVRIIFAHAAGQRAGRRDNGEKRTFDLHLGKRRS